jgi:hypothetical protein
MNQQEALARASSLLAPKKGGKGGVLVTPSAVLENDLAAEFDRDLAVFSRALARMVHGAPKRKGMGKSKGRGKHGGEQEPTTANSQAASSHAVIADAEEEPAGSSQAANSQAESSHAVIAETDDAPPAASSQAASSHVVIAEADDEPAGSSQAASSHVVITETDDEPDAEEPPAGSSQAASAQAAEAEDEPALNVGALLAMKGDAVGPAIAAAAEAALARALARARARATRDDDELEQALFGSD